MSFYEGGCEDPGKSRNLYDGRCENQRISMNFSGGRQENQQSLTILYIWWSARRSTRPNDHPRTSVRTSPMLYEYLCRLVRIPTIRICQTSIRRGRCDDPCMYGGRHEKPNKAKSHKLFSMCCMAISRMIHENKQIKRKVNSV